MASAMALVNLLVKSAVNFSRRVIGWAFVVVLKEFAGPACVSFPILERWEPERGRGEKIEVVR